MPSLEGRILLVEEDPMMQSIVERILNEAGYEAFKAVDDAGTAFHTIEKWRPDLILMDIGLCGEIDGFGVTERIRERWELPVVLLSENSSAQTLERFRGTSSYGLVTKPFEPAQLVAAVGAALHRFRLDQKVFEDRKLLASVLGNIDEGIISIDHEGRILFANSAARKLLSDPPPEGAIIDVLRSVFPRDHEEISTYFENLLRDGLPGDAGELSLRDPEHGSLRLKAQRMLSDGVTRGFVLVLRDLTKQERTLRQLRYFKKAVDGMQIGVTITDLERQILYINEAEASMHGYDAEELIGKNSRSLGVKEVSDGRSEWLERPTRWSRESLNRRRDGSSFPVQLYSDLLFDARGEAAGLITCCRDLSVRKAAEAEIRKLSQVVEQSPALVVITDIEGNIEYINPQFEKTTGYTMEEALGANPRILKTEDNPPELYEELWSKISKGGVWHGEFHNRKKDGSTYWAFASISGIPNAAGEIERYVGIQVDITRLKKLEKELEEKNTDLQRLNRLKGDMMAITSHDLKSPLNGMISLASMIRDLGDRLDREKLNRYLDHIIAEGQKLRSFISGILDAERLESGGLSLDLERAPLEKVLESCVETARMEACPREISVELENRGGRAEFLLDFTRLAQVFQNLLSNAIKFSPKTSKVSLILEVGEESSTVRVCDEGPGIPEDATDRIFDRYYQVESGGATVQRAFGAGLGLYVCRQIVEMHEGTIGVKNRPEGGCCFIVELPHRQSYPSESEEA